MGSEAPVDGNDESGWVEHGVVRWPPHTSVQLCRRARSPRRGTGRIPVRLSGPSILQHYSNRTAEEGMVPFLPEGCSGVARMEFALTVLNIYTVQSTVQGGPTMYCHTRRDLNIWHYYVGGTIQKKHFSYKLGMLALLRDPQIKESCSYPYSRVRCITSRQYESACHL